jgi:hypothetical protein
MLIKISLTNTGKNLGLLRKDYLLRVAHEIGLD